MFWSIHFCFTTYLTKPLIINNKCSNSENKFLHYQDWHKVFNRYFRSFIFIGFWSRHHKVSTISRMKIQNILYRGKIFQYGIIDSFLFVFDSIIFFFYSTNLLSTASDRNFKFDQMVISTVTVFQNSCHGVTQIDRVQRIMEEHMRNGFCRNFSLGKTLKIYKTYPFEQILTG